MTKTLSISAKREEAMKN